MLNCSRCQQRTEELIVTAEENYCPECYDLEECEMLYGRGGDYSAFCDVSHVLVNINGAYYVRNGDKINGYICEKCGEHVWGKSVLTGYCVSCAGKLLEDIYREEDWEPVEFDCEPVKKGEPFSF